MAAKVETGYNERVKARELKAGDTVIWSNRVRAKVKAVTPDGSDLRIDWEGYPEYSLYDPDEEVNVILPKGAQQ